MQRYEENYYRACALILKHGAKSKRGLLNHHLDKSGQTLYQFIELHGHDILHLHVGKTKCCRCQNLSTYIPPNGRLYRSQMNVLFGTNNWLPLHRHGVLSNEYCCRLPNPSLTADNLDISLLNSLFTHFCSDLFWKSSMKEKTLNAYLNERKHNLYHLWRINQPCCFKKCPSNKNRRIDNSQWKTIFNINTNLSSCQKGAACSCGYEAKSGIQINEIDKDLANEILHFTCTLKQAVEGIVELHNTYIAHATENMLSDMKFLEVQRGFREHMEIIAEECQSDVLTVDRIIKDVKEMPLDLNMCTQLKTILLLELVEKTDINKNLQTQERKFDKMDEKNDRKYEELQKMMTEISRNMNQNRELLREEINKPYWFLQAFKNVTCFIGSSLGLWKETKINTKIKRIIQDIQISQILDYMMTHLVISSDDRRRIEHHAGQDDQNKALLCEVIKRGEPTYTVFIDALRTSGYPDLANELKSDGQEEGSSAAIVQTGNIENKGLSYWIVPMYKVRLQKNYSNIIDSIQHEQIVDHLISRDVLTIAESQMINACPAQIQKNRKLMDILLHGSEHAFIEFLKALRKDSVYAELADKIENTTVASRDISTVNGCFK